MSLSAKYLAIKRIIMARQYIVISDQGFSSSIAKDDDLHFWTYGRRQLEKAELMHNEQTQEEEE